MDAGPNPPYSGFNANAANTGAKPMANAPSANAIMGARRESKTRERM